MRLVFDLEGNNLRDKCTKMWCMVYHNLENGLEGQIDCPEGRISGTQWQEMKWIFNSSKIIIGHNIINYDLPVLKKLFGLNYNGEIIDTLILSKLLNPDLDKFVKGVSKPHSLEAWGKRLGIEKYPDLDWSRWSSDMISRCKRDVEINIKVYEELSKELK